MENATKIVLIAVAVIIVAIIIMAAFSLVNTGQGLLDTGKKQITSGVSNYSEAAYTVYDNASVAGTQVRSAIKDAWTGEKDNTISVIVCTKDGYTVHYDKSGINTKALSSAGKGGIESDGDVMAKSLPTDCKNNQLVVGKEVSDTKQTIGVGGQPSKYVDPTNGTITQIGGDANSVTALKDRYNGVTSFDAVSGYKASLASNEAGYISANANFRGSLSRDLNGAIRVITFVQQ